MSGFGGCKEILYVLGIGGTLQQAVVEIQFQSGGLRTFGSNGDGLVKRRKRFVSPRNGERGIQPLLIHLQIDVGVSYVFSFLTAVGVAKHKSQFLNRFGFGNSIKFHCIINSIAVHIVAYFGHFVSGVATAPSCNYMFPIALACTQIRDNTGVQIHLTVAIGKSAVALRGIKIKCERLCGRRKSRRSREHLCCCIAGADEEAQQTKEKMFYHHLKKVKNIDIIHQPTNEYR